MQFLFYYCYKYCSLGIMSFTRRRDEKLYLRYMWARISEPSLSPVYTQRSGSHQLSVFLDYRAISIHMQTQLGSACLKSAFEPIPLRRKKNDHKTCLWSLSSFPNAHALFKPIKFGFSSSNLL